MALLKDAMSSAYLVVVRKLLITKSCLVHKLDSGFYTADSCNTEGKSSTHSDLPLSTPMAVKLSLLHIHRYPIPIK